MKKALKFLGLFLAGIVALIACAAVFFAVRGIPTYEVNAPQFNVRHDSVRIAEGKRIVSMTCVHCHRGEDGKLSGTFMADMSAGPFGKIYSKNLTNHPEAGIAKYTDAELALLLRSGIRRDGKFAPPFMPRFNHMSDEDLEAIIAFLRSDDPQVQPAEIYQPEWQPTFLAKVLGNLVFKPLPYPAQPIVAPPADDAVAHGEYLVSARYHCNGCHSPSFADVDPFEPEKTPNYLSGGNPMQDEDGRPINTPNLTPDRETGLGNWTEAQFVEAVRFAKHPSGRALRRPMTPYAAMSEQEASAIWSYLRTVPAVHHVVDRQAEATVGN
jgi:mono/diheme cytochrome c family protein